ncbi:MAG: hypothetical protein ACOYN0_09385 [Phycisphaerales bacterium]
MTRHTALTVVAALVVSAPLCYGQIGEYDFTFNQQTSGISGTLSSTIATAGTLVGNYDATANPTGTRTKPGLFGSFGATENVPVPVTLGGGLNGDLDSATSGLFRMDANAFTGALSLTGFEANFLATGSLDVPITVSLEFDTFRTRSPSSTYIGGFPLTLPIGSASVSQFSVRQVGPSIGTMTPNGTGGYDVLVAPLVELTLSLQFLGTEFAIPAITIPFPLAGQLDFTGQNAALSSLTPLAFDQSFDIGVAIPQQAFALPTILPPGGTANVLFDLTLDSIGAALSAEIQTNATGTLIPTPGLGAVVLGCAVAGGRRRRY